MSKLYREITYEKSLSYKNGIKVPFTKGEINLIKNKIDEINDFKKCTVKVIESKGIFDKKIYTIRFMEWDCYTITKYEDDWFYILYNDQPIMDFGPVGEVSFGGEFRYICDQVEGVLECIEDTIGNYFK